MGKFLQHYAEKKKLDTHTHTHTHLWSYLYKTFKHAKGSFGDRNQIDSLGWESRDGGINCKDRNVLF